MHGRRKEARRGAAPGGIASPASKPRLRQLGQRVGLRVLVEQREAEEIERIVALVGRGEQRPKRRLGKRVDQVLARRP